MAVGVVKRGEAFQNSPVNLVFEMVYSVFEMAYSVFWTVYLVFA